MVPNHEKKVDYYKNPCLSHCWMNFTSNKDGGKKSFLNEAKASMSFIPLKKMSWWCPIMKEKRGLLCESMFIPIDKETLILKTSRKRKFPHETKASMSFIPRSRMSFWQPIKTRKKVIK